MKRHLPEIKKILSIRDIAVKIICVLLAVILWAYISSTNISEIKFKIPVIFTNLPDSLLRTEQSDKYVTVTLSGRKDLIKEVNAKSIKAVVDLGTPGIDIVRKYPIEISREEIPENINISLSIKEVSLKVERKISKKIIIKANIIKKNKNNYILGKVRIVPESINISGPESTVKNIDFLQTEKLTITNAEPGIIEKEILIDNRNLPDLLTDVKSVKVFIPVIDSSGLTEFRKKLVLKYNNDKYVYSLSQQEVSVFIRSDKPDMHPTEEDVDVFVNIDIKNIDAYFADGNNKFIEKFFPVVAVAKEEGIKVISVSPDIVSVRISEE